MTRWKPGDSQVPQLLGICRLIVSFVYLEHNCTSTVLPHPSSPSSSLHPLPFHRAPQPSPGLNAASLGFHLSRHSPEKEKFTFEAQTMQIYVTTIFWNMLKYLKRQKFVNKENVKTAPDVVSSGKQY